MVFSEFKMADFTSGFSKVCDIFGISSLNEHQKTAIIKIVSEKKDVFVNLPTGFGKSLIYQALPIVLDQVYPAHQHIVIVVSPLLTLIQNQVNTLNDIGLAAVSLSHIEDEKEVKKVLEGCYSYVYTTPETLIRNESWRKMLTSSVYTERLCAFAVDEAHVIKQW